MPSNLAGGAMGAAPVSRDEIRGLHLARGGAITSLISLLLAFLSPILIILVSGLEIHYGGFHIGSGKFNNHVFEELIEVIIVGFLVGLVAMILYLVSFNSFRKVQPGFGGPLALVILGVIGTFLVFVGLADVLMQYLSAVGCVGSHSTTSCVSTSALFGAIGAILFGLLLALLGWIGLVIGVYRIGKRYQSTITKVGGILTIIPIVTIVAPILIIIGTSASLSEVQSRAVTR
jgi:MFS family permease